MSDTDLAAGKMCVGPLKVGLLGEGVMKIMTHVVWPGSWNWRLPALLLLLFFLIYHLLAPQRY